MKGINAFLIPREDAYPEELKRLGEAILYWIEDEQEENVGAFADPGPINDLLSGGLPEPLALQEIIGPYEIPSAFVDLVESKGGDPSLITEDELEEIGVGYRPPEPGALRAAQERLGSAASLRGVRLGYSPAPPNGMARFKNTVKGCFPEEVIQDILIGGVSWNDI